MKRIALLAASLLLGGSAVATEIGELRLLSVEAVDYHDQAYLPNPWENAAVDSVDLAAHLAARGQAAPSEKPHKVLLRVGFEGPAGLSGPDGPNMQPFLCNRSSEADLASMLSLAFATWSLPGDLSLSTGFGLGARPIEDAGAGAPNTYFVLINPAQRMSSSLPLMRFNLLEKSESTCLYFESKDETGATRRSRTLVIPADLIAIALHGTAQFPID